MLMKRKVSSTSLAIRFRFQTPVWASAFLPVSHSPSIRPAPQPPDSSMSFTTDSGSTGPPPEPPDPPDPSDLLSQKTQSRFLAFPLIQLSILSHKSFKSFTSLHCFSHARVFSLFHPLNYSHLIFNDLQSQNNRARGQLAFKYGDSLDFPSLPPHQLRGSFASLLWSLCSCLVVVTVKSLWFGLTSGYCS